MHAEGEIKDSNRFDTQPVLGGGWKVIDRVNGFEQGLPFRTPEDARAYADRLNSTNMVPTPRAKADRLNGK